MVNPTSSLNINWFIPSNDQIKDQAAENDSNPAANKKLLLPEQLTAQKSILYKLVKRDISENFRPEKFDLRSRSFIQQWASQQDNWQKFRQTAMESLIKNVSGYRIEAVSHRELAFPSLEALMLRAQYYQEKYKIIICVANYSQLSDLITELQARMTTPTYIGILVDLGIKNSFKTHLHVVPLLCYFDGQKGEKNEFLILESIALVEYINLIKNLLQTKGIPPEAINNSTKIRQADADSCRTSSITLVRNALLSLRHYQHQNGFKKALKAGRLNPDQTIDELPPDWDYTEQISNKLPSAPAYPLVRHYFSKEDKKRLKQETVLEHRQRHTEEMISIYHLVEDTCDYREKFQEFGIPENQDITDNKGLFFYVNQLMCNLSFKQKRLTNVYLLKKGFSNKSKDTAFLSK